MQKISSLFKYIFQERIIIGIILLGIVMRLLFAFLFNHVFDFFNILVIVKSVADTSDVTSGFYVLKDTMGLNVQLYGKIYYQIAAVWMKLLDATNIIDINYVFDLSPYNPTKQYMRGFGSWGPLHYQLVALKLIQFVYDAVLLFYLIKSANLLYGNKKSLIIVTTFWACTPYLIYPSYVPFQSDLAMVACLTGAVYYALLILKTKEEHKYLSRNRLLLLIFLALGAVIKQVPALFLVPLLILLSSSIPIFITNIFVWIVLYITFSQPWGTDAPFFKNFFLTSEESTAIFNFTLNGASIFILSYLAMLLYTLFYKKIIVQNPFNILKLCIIIFCIIFISEDLRYLFAQFAIWPLPTIILLMIDLPVYGIAQLAPVAGFYRWIVVDNSSMTASLWITLGKGLDKVPSFNALVWQLISPKIIHTVLNSIFIFSYVCVLIFTLQWIKDRKKTYFNLNPLIIVLALPLLYTTIFLGDYLIRSKNISLINIDFHELQQFKLGKKPYVMHISNPKQRKITGITPSIYRKKANTNDHVVIRLTDLTNNQVITMQKYNDMKFPEDEQEFYLSFDKPVSNKQIKVEIYKEYGHNELFINRADRTSLETLEAGYAHYDNFYRSKQIEINFPRDIFVVNVQGTYTWTDIASNIMYHYQQKPTFYLAYTTLLSGLLIISLYLLLPVFWKRRSTTHNVSLQ